MMNGVCCVYQQNEEQKLREAIRQDIRSEYHSMYHQQQPSQHQDIVIEKPIPSPCVGACISMDGEESVFIMSSLHIQEECRVNLFNEKGKAKKRVLPNNLTPFIHSTTNLPMSSCDESAASFKHDDVLSPFIKLSHRKNNSINNIEIQEEDVDEEIERIVTSSTSWTTITIV